jgi:hypothetical protein
LKARIDELPHLRERRILGWGGRNRDDPTYSPLATAEGPLAPAAIARRIRGASSNEVNTLLGRLADRQLVRRRPGASRSELRYDVAEPLFRVWRRFRVGRAEQARIVVLAEFVLALFTPAELLAERLVLARSDPGSSRLPLLDEALKLRASGVRDGGGEADAGGNPEAVFTEADREYLTGSLHRAYDLSRQAIGIRHAATLASGRSSLLHLCVATVRARGPEALVEVIPFLESCLPAGQEDLLRPMRLAVEVRAGRRSSTLPDEPEEVRRAVAAVLDRFEAERT